MPDRKQGDDEQGPVMPRPFWSGIIAFGLVSLPVSLFPANRGKSFHLRMVDEDGTPLRRRFFCEKDDAALERDDIVRGYEVEKDHFVVVDDDELEALAPEKSREIDLKRFVSLSDINPIYFERAYFLVPDGGATKAYRLLARSMEDAERAGIATFVMRDKEYLVAIIARNGILRAETLHFHDEVRSPGMIGLPEIARADKTRVKAMQDCMKKLKIDKLEREHLADQEAARTLELIGRKLKSGKDVIEAPVEEPDEMDEEETNVIDLMQVLKDRLQGREPQPPAGASAAAPETSRDDNDLADSSKAELYEMAQELNIPGRSSMSKRELIDAITRH